MQNLIPVLNKLQNVFSTVGSHAIDLPQIVVVGCQSAGKSSVLEAIVQKDFLPRNAGICTRRPLILQLIHIDDNHNPREWGEFSHAPGKKFTDFDKIRKEIEDATDRECGTNKGVTDKPINLAVYSPNVLNLTLVDLPGLTKIAVEDQPADIADQIEKMVMSYIKPENAIILAITPANTDLANSDSLIAARKVDPKGNRTIGVLTKLDIMDNGTDARDILLNKVYPLKLGYIGVVNRSQQDINQNKKVAAAAEAERKFFVSNPAYADIADNCGTAYLARTLNELLMRHIKSKIPSLYAQVNDLLAQKTNELAQYGSSIGSTLEEQQLLLFDMVSKYMEEFTGLLHGSSHNLSTNGLDGGSSIISILVDEFPQKMLSIPSVKEVPISRVETMIKNNSGIGGSLFFPQQTFQTLINQEIEKLRPCAIECVQNVKKALIELHNSVDVPELSRFSSLRDGIVMMAQENVIASSQLAEKFINQLIDVQIAYVNTSHPDFQGMHIDFGAIMNNVSALVDLVHRYYVVVRKEIMDSIPKAIFKYVLTESTDELRLQIVNKFVLNPDLSEDPIVVEKRNKCIQYIRALKEAQSILAEVRKARA